MCRKEGHLILRIVITDESGKVLLKGKSAYGRLSPNILQSPIYHDLVERDPSMAKVENLLERYSTDYKRKYPNGIV